MRTIIAGSRHLDDYALVERAVEESGFEPTVVLSGAGRGIDRQGEEWALRRGILMERYPAMWNIYGRKAGPIRNEAMVRKADALIAVWDGSTRGTAHIIEYATEWGLRVHVLTVPESS